MTIIAVAATALSIGLMAGRASAAVTAADLKALHLDVVPCRAHNADQEAADRQLTVETFAVMQKRDMATLDAMMPRLRVAFDHAPDVAVAPELCGNKVIIYAADDTRALVLQQAIRDGVIPGAKAIERRPELPYGQLGFIIGWIAFEHKDYPAALTGYKKGLKNEPSRPSLESEYLVTLSNLGRHAEALQSVDAFVADNPDLGDKDRANFLRKRGYMLGELKRWDEAEAAYRASLAIEPESTFAKNELLYIASQRGKS